MAESERDNWAGSFRSLRIPSAIRWIFCSVSTRLASARAVRSAAWRSRHDGFLLVRAPCFDRLNKPMIPSLSIAGGPPTGSQRAATRRARIYVTPGVGGDGRRSRRPAAGFPVG